jgi:hypothetical protein
MRNIIFMAWALIALLAANPASAAQRHHPHRAVQQTAVDGNAGVRDSHAEFGPTYQGYDARAWGGAISAPAGR